MAVVRLRPKNQITLPGEVVDCVGLREGDCLDVTADGSRIVITAQGLRDGDAGYTMSDLLGAASGLYRSVDEVDAEIAQSRNE